MPTFAVKLSDGQVLRVHAADDAGAKAHAEKALALKAVQADKVPPRALAAEKIKD